MVADLSDQAALSRAVEGATGVYFLSPPDMRSRNFVEERKALTARQVATLASAKVPHMSCSFRRSALTSLAERAPS